LSSNQRQAIMILKVSSITREKKTSRRDYYTVLKRIALKVKTEKRKSNVEVEHDFL